MMARAEGVCSPIFSTQRHLAKSAPSFLYWAQRSDSPSSPVEGTEESKHGREGGTWLPHTLGTQRGTELGGLVGRAGS